MTNTADELISRLAQWSPCPPDCEVEQADMRDVARAVIAFLDASGLTEAAAYACNDAVMALAMVAQGDGNRQLNAANFAAALVTALDPSAKPPPVPTIPVPTIGELYARLDSEFLMVKR